MFTGTEKSLLLEQVVPHLRSLTRGVVEILQESQDGLTLRIGRHDGAIISMRISDLVRPSFRVSYPKLVVKRDGSRHVTEQTVDGVVTDGLDWIVEQLLRHGIVKPEFE